MALSKNELIQAINGMTIYKRDYDTISNLLSITSDELFTKIVEEVVNGTLYWSDFETFLAETEYPDIVEDNLKIQDKLWKSINRIIEIKRSLNEDYQYGPDLYGVALIKSIDNPDEINKVYDEEYRKYRDTVLYELSKVYPNDSSLVKAFKVRFYNAIRNGEIILNSKDSNISENSNIGTVDETYATNKDNPSERFEYINPEDVFLFLNEYAIPVDYNLQRITNFDRLFMTQYNVSEELLKQIKSVSLFLKMNNPGGSNDQ